MSTENEDAINILTERVNNLYKEIFNVHQPADTIKKPVEVIEETTCTFKEVESRHNVVKQLWKKLPLLNEYLSSEFLTKVGLTDDVKTSLVLASENNLKSLATQLTKLKSLENVPNDSVLKGVPDHSKKLQPIIQGQLDQKDELDEVNERTQLLLSAYNNVISTLSKQFIIWNNLVTQCEMTLDADRSPID